MDNACHLAGRARAYVRGRDKAANEFPLDAEGAEHWTRLRGLLLELADAVDADDKSRPDTP